jgi:hypothetical protein
MMSRKRSAPEDRRCRVRRLPALVSRRRLYRAAKTHDEPFPEARLQQDKTPVVLNAEPADSGAPAFSAASPRPLPEGED